MKILSLEEFKENVGKIGLHYSELKTLDEKEEFRSNATLEGVYLHRVVLQFLSESKENDVNLNVMCEEAYDEYVKDIVIAQALNLNVREHGLCLKLAEKEEIRLLMKEIDDTIEKVKTRLAEILEA